MSGAVRIGTRGSQLALWQANTVAARLRDAGRSAEIVILKTTGDRRRDVPLASIGGKGLFIKEIEEALTRDEVDIGVHSLKDVPSLIPDRFVLAGFLERADPRDAWLQRDGRQIADMDPGSIIGTSSPRRRAQLRRLYPSLGIADLRGNVETRIGKMRSGEVHGCVLAAAGLTRLGRDGEITSRFPVEEMVPAAGQGIVAIEALATRGDMIELAGQITHAPSETAANVERGLLQQFESILDCYSAVGAHAVVGEELRLEVFFSDVEATRAIRFTETGSDAGALISRSAARLREAGAVELLRPREPGLDV